MSNQSHRPATHSGSWYSNNRTTLTNQLTQWLNSATLPQSITSHINECCAVISPHAGYSYSGSTAAYSYKVLQEKVNNNNQIINIFILGPSHHYYTNKCEVTQYTHYDSPINSIPINTEICNKLVTQYSNMFSYMKHSVDNDEHSIELQLSFISHIMSNKQYKLVPILIGSIYQSTERQYGELLAEYILDKQNFFIMSSDFCHWGSRFQYTYTVPDITPIYKSIEYIDKQAMMIISQSVVRCNVNEWYTYMKQTQNTICGRHPISVYLNAIVHIQQQNNNQQTYTLPFIAYTQSSHCETKRDSSVSYAAGVCVKCQTIQYDTDNLATPEISDD